MAMRHGVSESVLLRRLIDDALVTAGEAARGDAKPQLHQPPEKLSVRLRPEDFRLLRERAEVRKIRLSTYVALFVRAHLRNLSPLPTAELAALKRSIAEVGAIGRNLNQIARAMNTGGQGDVVEIAYLQGLMKVLAGLRDHTKSLVTANALSWEAGNEHEESIPRTGCAQSAAVGSAATPRLGGGQHSESLAAPAEDSTNHRCRYERSRGTVSHALPTSRWPPPCGCTPACGG